MRRGSIATSLKMERKETLRDACDAVQRGEPTFSSSFHCSDSPIHRPDWLFIKYTKPSRAYVAGKMECLHCIKLPITPSQIH